MIKNNHKELIEKTSEIFKISENKIQIINIVESVAAACYHLEVEISKDHTKKIFVKMGSKHGLSEDNRQEVKFYQIVEDAAFDLAVPSCHFAMFNEQTGQSLLILDNYSDSHEPITEWPVSPKTNDCKKAISVLAEIHAKFWNHPELEMSLASPPDNNEKDNETALFLSYFEEFTAFLGDRINQETIEIYKKAISNYYPLLTGSFCENKHKTLCHGDAHIWNFLFPKETESSVYIIDWSSWELGVGVEDLAYMIGLHWHPVRRKQFELDLIKFYHSQLIANGVKNYSFEACYNDYRIGILGNHFIPIWQWKNGIPAHYWWPHFERASHAYIDLNCDELLK
mgnify:CR=1 FL=1